MPTAHPTPSPADPARLLCEACGYPLTGTVDGGACPECGEPVAESNPSKRTGPAWERKTTPRAWAATAAAVIGRPRLTFRHLAVGGSALPARLFVLSIVVLWFANPATAVGLAWGDPRLVAAGVLAAKTVVVLTYLEALGLVFIGRQRGWRLPLVHAERVVAYAAAGWLIGLPLFWAMGLLFLVNGGSVWGGRAGAIFIDLPWIGVFAPTPAVWLVLGAIGIAVVALPFEMLAYVGARQCRFANATRPRAH